MGSGQGQAERWDVAYRLKFSGRAVREIGEAHDWYEERSPGLGSEFQLAFGLQLKRVEQVPLMWGCTEFCVNGQMAGNRRTSRSGYDRKYKESSTQRPH